MLYLLSYVLKQFLGYLSIKAYYGYINTVWGVETKLEISKSSFISKLRNTLQLYPNPLHNNVTLRYKNNLNLRWFNLLRIINRNIRPDKTQILVEQFSNKHDWLPTNYYWYTTQTTKTLDVSTIQTLFNLFATIRLRWANTTSFSYYYLQGMIIVMMIDASIIDDEPLWEPIEWSLVQTWILIIFLFGWIAETLITSRYGSYTGRDKRVWMSWYKTFWLVEIFYMINFLAAAMFIILPFYFELNHTLPFISTWWNWYNRTFFLSFISLFTLIVLLAQLMQMGVRWLSWDKILLLVTLVNFFLSYLLYTQFIISFFGYITNPLWYQQNRSIDYIQLSHEPSKWAWGSAGTGKRDHVLFHNSHTRFWFKNDGPFAAAMMLFNMYIFLSLFFIYIYWVALFRRIYSTKEVPLTYVTYCVSALRQLLYAFLFLYFLIFLSFITSYWRLPIELSWDANRTSWVQNTFNILTDYPLFIYNIFTVMFTI